jgi:hypothetical protein
VLGLSWASAVAAAMARSTTRSSVVCDPLDGLGILVASWPSFGIVSDRR